MKTTTIQQTETLKDRAAIAQGLHEEIETLSAQLKSIMELKNRYDALIIEDMIRMNLNKVVAEDIMIDLKICKGKATYSYKELYENALTKVNGTLLNFLLKTQEEKKKVNPDRMSISITKTK